MSQTPAVLTCCFVAAAAAAFLLAPNNTVQSPEIMQRLEQEISTSPTEPLPATKQRSQRAKKQEVNPEKIESVISMFVLLAGTGQS